MSIVVQLVRADYLTRLHRADVPLDPAARTPEQQQTAALEFWAAQNEVALDAATLAQAAVEVKP